MNDLKECPSVWDDELEHLSAEAAAVVGEEAVIASVERAFLRFRLERAHPPSFADMKDALKRELRRIVRPQ